MNAVRRAGFGGVEHDALVADGETSINPLDFDCSLTLLKMPSAVLRRQTASLPLTDSNL
jgi:hypothetical protein